MSIRCQNWVFEHSESRGNDRLVLLVIADEADDDGSNAYPGIERIALKARLPVRTVMRCVERLETEGALLVQRPEKPGRGRFNRYVVVMGELSKGATLSCGKVPPSAPSGAGKKVPEVRGKIRKDARPYVIGHRPPDPLTHNPLPDTREETTDEMPPDLRAGVEVETQETPAAPDLLVAVAQAAPPSARYQLLDDPEQVTGRSALRSRLAQLAAQLGPDAAVTVVAGEWPAAVASPMAHANARARAALGGHPVTVTRPRPPDPFDGMAEAARALAERLRLEREAEEATSGPRVPPPPGWKAQLRAELYPPTPEPAEVSS